MGCIAMTKKQRDAILEEAALVAAKHPTPDGVPYYNIWGKACLSVAEAIRALKSNDQTHEG